MKKTRTELIEKLGLEAVQMIDKRLSKHWFDLTDEEKAEHNKSDNAWHKFVMLCSGMDNEDFADTMREFEPDNRIVLEEIIADCVG